MGAVKVRMPSGNFRRVDLDTLDEGGLRELLTRLHGEKDYVDAQGASEAASIIIGQHIGKVQTELGRRMRVIRAANAERSRKESAVFERQFLFVAKRILPDDLYQQCLGAAKAAVNDSAEVRSDGE